MFCIVQLVKVTAKSHCKQSVTGFILEKKVHFQLIMVRYLKMNNLILFVLPSVSTVRAAVQTASPAELDALQVYCPACSEKASTMINVAVLVISSK